MTGDTFTRNKMLWIEQLTLDQGLNAPSVRIGLAIAYHLSRKEGCSRPSIPTMAREIGVSENTVRTGIRALVDRGHIAVENRGGRHLANVYRIVVTGVDNGTSSTAGNEPKPSKKLKGIDREKGFKNLKGIAEKPFNSEGETLQNSDEKPFRILNPNPLIEPIVEPSGDISPPTPSLAKLSKAKGAKSDAAFEAFWRAYPRKVSKGQARRAWAKAVDLVSPDAIVAGAERYARERQHEESRFTKHPATWLHAEGWADEAQPIATEGKPGFAPARDTFAILEQSLAEQRSRAVAKFGGHPMSTKDRTAAAIERMLAGDDVDFLEDGEGAR